MQEKEILNENENQFPMFINVPTLKFNLEKHDRGTKNRFRASDQKHDRRTKLMSVLLIKMVKKELK